MLYFFFFFLSWSLFFVVEGWARNHSINTSCWNASLASVKAQSVISFASAFLRRLNLETARIGISVNCMLSETNCKCKTCAFLDLRGLVCSANGPGALKVTPLIQVIVNLFGREEHVRLNPAVAHVGLGV